MGRIKIVRLRIRGGKVQRRKKVANLPNTKMQDGKVVRMSVTERRKRKLGAKRASRKRKTKMRQILRKRKRSLLKRKRLGG